MAKAVGYIQRAAEQVIEREAKTATFSKTVFGFPHAAGRRFRLTYLSRSAFGDFTNRYRRDNKNLYPAQIRRLNFLCDDAQLLASLRLDSLEPTLPHSYEESDL